jgi:hypothetical protein
VWVVADRLQWRREGYQKNKREEIMELRRTSIAMIAVASGLLFSSSHIRGVLADDRHDRACSNKTLEGSYGFYRTGTTPTGPLTAVGILFFDGEGNAFARQSISRNGVFTFDVEFPNTYEVAEDCTAKHFIDTAVEFVRMVIVDGGKEFYILSETAGNTVYGVGKKIHTSEHGHGR